MGDLEFTKNRSYVQLYLLKVYVDIQNVICNIQQQQQQQQRVYVRN
jgi:hypothetical protein